MNEWELQDHLSTKWRAGNFIFNDFEYQLVCWELMFPSWLINNNKSKWNEVSIDFILYSTELSQFLCVELKNKISGKQKLLSGYCQATHRAVNFIEQYDSEKMNKARRVCFSESSFGRGGKETIPEDINFSNNPVVKRVLMARKFPSIVNDAINHWDSLNQLEIKQEISKYAVNKEFERFNAMTEEQFNLIEDNPLSIIQID